MERIKSCPICGNAFTASKPNQRYCSIICREVGRKLKRMEWSRDNPTYNADYMRRYRAEHS